MCDRHVRWLLGNMADFQGIWNRRNWTDREEEVLLTTLKELVVQGWKSDNGDFAPDTLLDWKKRCIASFRQPI